MGLARRTRLRLEELEPRDLPSSTGLSSFAAPPTAAFQKQITSELVMEFMVAASAEAGSGLAQGIFSSSGPTTLFRASVAPPSPLRGMPVVIALAAGVAPGGLPASQAPAVAQGGGGTAATITQPGLDDSGDEDSLAAAFRISREGVEMPAALAPSEILHRWGSHGAAAAAAQL
jgi:hypothetical protein